MYSACLDLQSNLLFLFQKNTLFLAIELHFFERLQMYRSRLELQMNIPLVNLTAFLSLSAARWTENIDRVK